MATGSGAGAVRERCGHGAGQGRAWTVNIVILAKLSVVRERFGRGSGTDRERCGRRAWTVNMAIFANGSGSGAVRAWFGSGAGGVRERFGRGRARLDGEHGDLGEVGGRVGGVHEGVLEVGFEPTRGEDLVAPAQLALRRGGVTKKALRRGRYEKGVTKRALRKKALRRRRYNHAFR